MSEIRRIIDRFSLDELQVNGATKKQIRILTEYIHASRSSFATAIRLAALLLDTGKEKIMPTPEYAASHPENRIEVYSSPEIFLAFYLLMLSRKADNLYHISEERKRGVCQHLAIVKQNDKETCSCCKAQSEEMPISEACFENVPPFHVGCRCGILITK